MAGKSILVIDTPKDCFECPLHQILDLKCDGKYVMYCNANKDVVKGKGAWEKPLWCPLKQLPEPKDIGYPNEDYDVGFGDGWDACLKEMEK